MKSNERTDSRILTSKFTIYSELDFIWETMPITKKTILPLNLLEYDVYVEDTSQISEYFSVTNLPQSFTGGRNSFLIGGSDYLQNGSEIQLEIIDSKGKPIYQSMVPTYVEGDSKMISVEIYDDTAPGFATLVVMGKAYITSTGQQFPEEWKNVYNVRWTKRILVDYDLKNISPIKFENQPEVFVEEKRFYNINSSSYDINTIPFTASLTPLIYSPVQIGYSINAIEPSIFSANFKTGKFTGSVSIGGCHKEINLPITNILNKSKAFTKGYTIPSCINDGIVKQIYLVSGSYNTILDSIQYGITSSAKLQYSIINTSSINIPISYANLRVINLSTVSGEIYKFRVYTKPATSVADYKLVGDVFVTTDEILVSSSIRGNVPIGDIYQATNYAENWYAGKLTVNTGNKQLLYPVSGSLSYYDSSYNPDKYSVSSSDDVLLSSLYANVPINLLTNKFEGSVSQSGYFIGTTNSVTLIPTSEYTLAFDAYYKKTSGSITLVGNTPKVDIYLISDNNTKIIDDNPLGQRVGQIEIFNNNDSQWFEIKQFNFFPKLKQIGNVALRFVVTNGFWNFSNISLKPASDPQFAPDEAYILIPNTEYHNELLQYKVEFFDINNNSANVVAISTPVFFTGSAIDLGTLP